MGINRYQLASLSDTYKHQLLEKLVFFYGLLPGRIFMKKKVLCVIGSENICCTGTTADAFVTAFLGIQVIG
ncbi:hypothetical protein D5071_08955 [Pectobacterium carotovorum]|uniref:Uncharacterized protein n=1 Tax=Pectobacterium carotovorum TaxID=554 RepID=A0A419AXM3_PECCA|nr:hypothetical protein D5071_08955 [Pectobacterium carotovorum]